MTQVGISYVVYDIFCFDTKYEKKGNAPVAQKWDPGLRLPTAVQGTIRTLLC